jgi:hypothetical protein
MKNVLSLILLVFLAVSCDENGLNDRIVGKWEIEESVCFGCPTPFTNHPQGNGNIMAFKSNGAYERRESNIVVFKGKYSLKKDEDCDESNDTVLKTSEDQGVRVITIESGKLKLSTPSCYADGGIATYRKVK